MILLKLDGHGTGHGNENGYGNGGGKGDKPKVYDLEYHVIKCSLKILCGGAT